MPQRLHAYRGRSSCMVLMESCVPITRWAGLSGVPWLRGGVSEIGGTPYLIDEALVYDGLPFVPRSQHKDWMRSSPLRDRLLGVQMLGEDLPQLANRVDLDPGVRDVWGLPVARITYAPAPPREARLAALGLEAARDPARGRRRARLLLSGEPRLRRESHRQQHATHVGDAAHGRGSRRAR